MQTIHTDHSPRGGGRIASDAYRQSLDLCLDFTGLDQSTDRYQLLLLVKRVGKQGGFTPRMIQLLDYYMAYTTQADWEEGSRPIVFQSLSRTAMDLGVSERQIQKLEKQLFELGAITWNDSGNHKRYGKRDAKSGKLLYAYGVDLTPLAYLRPHLEDQLHQKQLYAQAWQQTKREISSRRREIRSLLARWQEEGAEPETLAEWERSYERIAVQLRTHMDLSRLRELLREHYSLRDALIEAMGIAQFAEKNRAGSDPEFAQKEYSTLTTNLESSPADKGMQEKRAEEPEPEQHGHATRLPRITHQQVLRCASERFRERLPDRGGSQNDPWNDLVAAAYQHRADLAISQHDWGDACATLGRIGAALCLVAVDRGLDRPVNRVQRPAAYFRGMVRKARAGELRLDRTFHGFLTDGLSRRDECDSAR